MTREERFDACPFCGCEEIVCGAFSISPDCYVTCTKCGAVIETDVSWKGIDSQEEHDKACKKALLPLWNNRAHNRPIPDPETGLVPCGCGKRAIFYGFDEERGDTKLIHRTAAGCPDCPATTDWEENQDDARRIWNKMMGYKEDA